MKRRSKIVAKPTIGVPKANGVKKNLPNVDKSVKPASEIEKRSSEAASSGIIQRPSVQIKLIPDEAEACKNASPDNDQSKDIDQSNIESQSSTVQLGLCSDDVKWSSVSTKSQPTPVFSTEGSKKYKCQSDLLEKSAVLHKEETKDIDACSERTVTETFEVSSSDSLMSKSSKLGSTIKRRTKFSFKPSVSSKISSSVKTSDAQPTNSQSELKQDDALNADKTSVNVTTVITADKDDLEKNTNLSISVNMNDKGGNKSEKDLKDANKCTRKVSGPPVIQRVSRLSGSYSSSVPNITTKNTDDSVVRNKISSTFEESTEISQMHGNDLEVDKTTRGNFNDLELDKAKNKNKSHDVEPDKISESLRKCHRSVLSELEDLKKKRRKFRPTGKRPERSEMKMLDLIYWNPGDDDSKKKNEVKTKEIDVSDNISRKIEEENVDNPDEQPEDYSAVGAPQLKIGPDGSIVIDEDTLLVKPAEVSTDNLENAPVVYGNTSTTTYASFKRKSKKRRWTAKETVKFFKALCLVGTDFSMMTNLIPNRTRAELKKKFVKEDRKHKDMVDCAINSKQLFKLELFEDSDESEEEVPVTQRGKRKRQPKNKRKNDEEVKPEASVEEDSDNDPSWSHSSASPKNVKSRRTMKRAVNSKSRLPILVESREGSPVVEGKSMRDDAVNINDSNEAVDDDDAVNLNDSNAAIDDGANIIHADIFVSPVNPLILSSADSNKGSILLSPQPPNSASANTELVLVRSDQHVHVYMISPSPDTANVGGSEDLNLSGSHVQGIKALEQQRQQ